MNTPLIKWTGSKRHLASKIISYFPSKIETYHEPFLGGGSVFLQLLKSNHNVRYFKLSDKNDSLINIFKTVKDNPTELINSYQNKWQSLQDDYDFYYTEREYYNKTKDPLSFYFLTRTCYNGTIRYNSLGNFNTSHHFGRAGMSPSKVKQIILYYHGLMKGKDIMFECNSFDTLCQFECKDVVYLDPPYTNTKALYFGNISFDILLNWINLLPCSWFMNINGINITDNEENISIPYTNKEILSSGKSSFSRMKGNDVSVAEYFYYNNKLTF
jgi:DNA adenine methylase